MKILITNKNKNNFLFGRSPHNQVVTFSDEENMLDNKHNLLNNFVDAKIFKANQNSLEAKLGNFER